MTRFGFSMLTGASFCHMTRAAGRLQYIWITIGVRYSKAYKPPSSSAARRRLPEFIAQAEARGAGLVGCRAFDTVATRPPNGRDRQMEHPVHHLPVVRAE